MLASRRGTAVYLLFYAANAALLPVLALYYESIGVTGTRLGVLTALWPAGNVLGASLWGAVADATGRHRLVLGLAILGAASLAQLVGVGTGFVMLLPAVSAFAVAAAPIGPMLDHAVLEDLGERHNRFGRVRLWGAVGWGGAAPLVGLIVDKAGLRSVFPIYAAAMLGLLVTTFPLRIPHTRLGAGIFGGLATIVRSPQWRRFLVTVFLIGTGGTLTHHYLFVYFASIGGSGSLRGIALAIATLSELAVFLFAERITHALRPSRLILVAMGGVGVRMILYGVIADPVVALLPQLLHGVSFALVLIAGVATARRLAPPGMGATAQALFSATHMGLGGVAGALLGGALFTRLTVPQAFLVVGVGELLLTAILLATGRSATLRSRRRSAQ